MDSSLPYRDPVLPVETRIADLLARMTLAEKCAQLVGTFGLVEGDGQFSLEFARQHFRAGIAYVNTHHPSRDTRQTVAYLNAVQRFLRDETRLGIPALGVGEGLHGYMAHEATSFPQAIALASAWDPDLHERIFRAVAAEMRARGAHFVLSPVLDLGRDPRWGRTEETYGEDPYLVSRLGVAAIRGLQGGQFDGKPGHVLATAKHFAAHGQPEAGTNAAPANYAERTLREELLAPFEAAVRTAQVGAVMASYNEINGIPSHVNPWLLQDVLRGEWGFAGLVISDGWGVDDLYRLHFVAADAAEAARKAFASGIELELGRCFYHLEAEVTAGRIPESALDAAVARVLRVKFQLGLFENPFVDETTALAVTNCAAHQDLALTAARQAVVLLKNDGGLLPLDLASLERLAVIGPNAAAVRLGGYSGDPGRGISVLDGIRQLAGDRLQVSYAPGCGLTQAEGRPHDLWFLDEVQPADPARDEEMISAAVEAARQAQVALLVLGDNEQTCREGWSVQHLGDRDSLELPGRQADLLAAVVATGVPVVLVLLHGRPLSLPPAAGQIPAMLTGWYLGQSGGTAIAEALFGLLNPGGKLPITFPRSVGQIPAYYYHKPSARRGYLFTPADPLFAFGHGLSYTTFEYSGLRLSAAQMPATGSVTLSVEVTNTGARPGDEVVQFYVRDRLSNRVTRPVKLLKGFARLHLQPGETRTVTFPVGSAELAYLDETMQRVVEPGEFELLVGGSSQNLTMLVLEVTHESGTDHPDET